MKDRKIPAIDWTAQWSAHGYQFRDGYVHVNLRDFGYLDTLLKLEPGPGFGDLSHPTTKLVLQMMSQYVPHRYVLDIGCGSGILSLAAAAMNAKHTHGIDIEAEAVEHSRKNAKLNHLEKISSFSLPAAYKKPVDQEIVVLMNMIQSEQLVAWRSVQQVHHLPGMALISGILASGRKAYLKQAMCWGWELIAEKELEGWLGFCFKLTGRASSY